jgi:di/tripeptidase
MTQIGSRPAGSIPRSTPLVQWAKAALQFVGCENPIFIAGSTDANIPLSQGITAVCVGLTESGNAHRLDEYIDTRPLPRGIKQLLLLTAATTT